MQSLQVRSLACGYERQAVVQDISFEVKQGCITGLVGLNGAGKTTLMKTILGLRKALKGAVQGINSKDTAFLPERFDPPQFLSGMEFIEFSLRLYGQKNTRSEIERRAQDISLSSKALHKSVQTYSKGMRQKLGLLATMMAPCSYIFLDEPMSGLDPKARQDVKKLILKGKESGQAVFFSSHILSDVAELCDDVFIVHNQRLVFKGSVEQMKKQGGNQSLEKAFLKIIDL